jgi:hypothetical protein
VCRHRDLRFVPDSTYVVHRSQDRGILAMCYHADSHLLLTSSWDSVLRIYDTRELAAKPVSVQNENESVFVGLAVDAATRQVRIWWFRRTPHAVSVCPSVAAAKTARIRCHWLTSTPSKKYGFGRRVW